MRKIFVVVFCLSSMISMISMVSVAQNNKVISGEVLDAKSNKALPFTNIVFAGKNVGTVTNAEGRFSININGSSLKDTIIFSFLGYDTVKKTVEELFANSTVYLKENSIELNVITVRSEKLEAKEIIKRVHDNYSKNYPDYNFRRKIYYHHDLKTVFNEARLELLKSSMTVVNKEFFDNVNRSFPDTIHAYKDILCNLYKYDSACKLKVINAISLIDKWDIEGGKEVEKVLNANSRDSKVYWKIRTGIVGKKIAQDSIESTIKSDSLVYKLKTGIERNNINRLLEEKARPDNAKWEFIRKPWRYNYKLEGGACLNNEYAYRIVFTPKKKGLYKGELFVSAENFAVLKMSYALSPDRPGKSLKLFGISYREKDSFITVLYDRDDKGYFPRYVYKRNVSQIGINRNVVLKQKRKRFVFDKTLKEVKSSLVFDMENTDVEEYLLMTHSECTGSEYGAVRERSYINFKKLKNYDAGVWGDYSIIKPTEEILRYKKKLEE